MKIIGGKINHTTPVAPIVSVLGKTCARILSPALTHCAHNIRQAVLALSLMIDTLHDLGAIKRYSSTASIVIKSASVNPHVSASLIGTRLDATTIRIRKLIIIRDNFFLFIVSSANVFSS